jgi:hypothetical protein
MTTPPVESVFVRLLDAVRTYCIGAQDGIVRMELFSAANEFLQRSDIWNAEVLIGTVVGVFLYQMPYYIEGGQINRLVWLEGQRPGVPPGSADVAVDGQIVTRGPARAGWLETTGSNALLRVLYSPTNQEMWRAHLALTCVDPTDANGLPTLPDFIVTKYWDYLLSGVVARLCGQPNKPYTNPQLVMFHGRKFMDGINLAKKEARAGFTLGGQRWAFPQTFRSKSQRMWP